MKTNRCFSSYYERRSTTPYSLAYIIPPSLNCFLSLFTPILLRYSTMEKKRSLNNFDSIVSLELRFMQFFLKGTNETKEERLEALITV